MKFSEYLKSKTKILVIWFCFHGFALFVNVFHIEYDMTDSNPPGVIKKRFLFTNSEYNSERKTFWPFVKFEAKDYYFTDEERKMLYDRADFSEWRVDKFNGIFFQYDISEFIAYGFLIFILLYFRWSSKKMKKDSFKNAK